MVAHLPNHRYQRHYWVYRLVRVSLLCRQCHINLCWRTCRADVHCLKRVVERALIREEFPEDPPKHDEEGGCFDPIAETYLCSISVVTFNLVVDYYLQRNDSAKHPALLFCIQRMEYIGMKPRTPHCRLEEQNISIVAVLAPFTTQSLLCNITSFKPCNISTWRHRIPPIPTFGTVGVLIISFSLQPRMWKAFGASGGTPSTV